jgi:hypothetical protein
MNSLTKNRTRLGLATAVAIALAVLAFAPGRAAADYSFTIDTGNPAISSYTAGYVSVNVHVTDTTHATITFTSLTAVTSGNTNIYLMGDGGTVDLNVNGSFSVASITGSNSGSGFTADTSYPNANTDFSVGSGNVDGWGSFNLTIDTTDGFKNSSNVVTVTLTGSGTNWSDTLQNVLTANDTIHNAVAAAHVFITSSPAVESNGALATGFAAGSGGGGTNVHNTPAPPSAVLLGLGFVGFVGFVARPRFRRKAAAA